MTQLITTQKRKPENKNYRFRYNRNSKYPSAGQQQKPKSPVKNPFIPHEIQDFIYKFLKDKPLVSINDQNIIIIEFYAKVVFS